MTIGFKSTAAAIAASVILASGPAAAALTGNVALSASVPLNCGIVVTPTGNSGIDLSINGNNLKVATVAEDCNNKAGYVIGVSTANGIAASASTGLFTGDTAGNPDTVPYSVKYKGPTLTFVNGVDSAARTANSKVSGQLSIVKINFTGDPLAAADTYSDTLNFTMTVN